MNPHEYLVQMVKAQQAGRALALGSVCSSNDWVLRATLRHAAGTDEPVLIESTSNQVNQFGGYTGMQPHDFIAHVRGLAETEGVELDRLIIGGDHLGPYPWRKEPAETAMEKARELVAACVQAGYIKIHLDASMALSGDKTDADGALSPEVVAEREADLAAVAERHAGRFAPMYVIGSEVPTPGGVVDENEPPEVTTVVHLNETVALCRDAFTRHGLHDAWSRVCAVVVQPGVEFTDSMVHAYRRDRAAELTTAARAVPGIVLEGHSTDYQREADLRAMVEDGVGILKVGPELTFRVREMLLSLERVEEALFAYDLLPATLAPSRLRHTILAAMDEEPSHWRGYYTGSAAQQRLAQLYSLSDRVRYYWCTPAIEGAIERLMRNLEYGEVPLPLWSQYGGDAFRSLRERQKDVSGENLVMESVRGVVEKYYRASRCVATASSAQADA